MKTVLFEHQHLYYLPQFLPIITAMKNSGQYQVEASLTSGVNRLESTVFRQVMNELNVPTISQTNESARGLELRDREYDIIFVGNIGNIKKVAGRNSFVVMVYHGIGLKQSYYRDHSPRVDLRIIESKQRFDELHMQGHTNMSLCGFAKMDLLNVEDVYLDSQWLSDLNLEKQGKTVILYAPTFYPSSIEKLLPHLSLLTEEYICILKLHHFSWHLPKYRHHYIQAKVLSERNDNIYLAPPDQYNIIPYYKIADLLVTDISSTLFEFLALNRPIIQSHFSTKRLKHIIMPGLLSRRLDANRYREIDFTYSLQNPRDLLTKIKMIDDSNDPLKSKRELAVKNFLYKIDGRTAERIIVAIEQHFDS
ncbi:MAG: CDP-glycerol glycerophosphotransferase family protein [Candidatus Neomarinimicrobiota bacterium]